MARDEDPDFVIMARTHSSRVTGMADAVERGLAYAEAGADIIFVDLGYSEDVVMEELRIIVEQIAAYVPCAANMTGKLRQTALDHGRTVPDGLQGHSLPAHGADDGRRGPRVNLR